MKTVAGAASFVVDAAGKASRGSVRASSRASLASWSGSLPGPLLVQLVYPVVVAVFQRSRVMLQGRGQRPAALQLLVQRRGLLQEFEDDQFVVHGDFPLGEK